MEDMQQVLIEHVGNVDIYGRFYSGRKSKREICIITDGEDITAVVASTLFGKATIPFSIPNLYAVYSYFKGER